MAGGLDILPLGLGKLTNGGHASGDGVRRGILAVVDLIAVLSDGGDGLFVGGRGNGGGAFHRLVCQGVYLSGEQPHPDGVAVWVELGQLHQHLLGDVFAVTVNIHTQAVFRHVHADAAGQCVIAAGKGVRNRILELV